jgi:ketosteroid isomerase-like protein
LILRLLTEARIRSTVVESVIERSLNEVRMTPSDVLELRRQALVARDMEAFADLFAPDAVIELPFAAGALPARLEGQEAIRDYSRQSAQTPVEIRDLRTKALHLTADPEVVIIELETLGRIKTTGQEFTVPCIQVFRIRDGRIVLFRDYIGASALPDNLH